MQSNRFHFNTRLNQIQIFIPDIYEKQINRIVLLVNAILIYSWKKCGMNSFGINSSLFMVGDWTKYNQISLGSGIEISNNEINCRVNMANIATVEP